MNNISTATVLFADEIVQCSVCEKFYMEEQDYQFIISKIKLSKTLGSL